MECVAIQIFIDGRDYPIWKVVACTDILSYKWWRSTGRVFWVSETQKNII